MVFACILIRAEPGRFHQVVERMKQFKEANKVFAVLGRYDVVVDVEAKDFDTLDKAILKMNRIAGVVFTETLIEIQMREEA